MKKADIAAGSIGIAIGGYVLVAGSRMPADHIMKIGPAFFPSILAALLIAFSAFLAIKGALSKEDGAYERFDFRSFPVWRALISLAISAAYALLMKRLGFIPTSILFVAGLMVLLGYRKPLGVILVSIGAAAAVYIVFSVLLVISLPAGIMSLVGM